MKKVFFAGCVTYVKTRCPRKERRILAKKSFLSGPSSLSMFLSLLTHPFFISSFILFVRAQKNRLPMSPTIERMKKIVERKTKEKNRPPPLEERKFVPKNGDNE